MNVSSTRGDTVVALQGPQPRTTRLSAAERRDQLSHVAARQFHRLGYHRVSLADVADEAGVTGPAVYRHFRNKEALLAAAITSGLDMVEAAVARNSASSLNDMVLAVADVGLHRPDMWVLLQRESRLLNDELATPIHAQFGRVVDQFSRRLRKERTSLNPDQARLLVTAATSVLSLPSTTHTSLSRPTYRRQLTAAALACLHADLSGALTHNPTPALPNPDDVATVRREQVVDSAIDLFFRRGYNAVSLDDIGAAVGIAGPSILHHFPTKADILVTAFDRASSQLGAEQKRRHTTASTLQELVAAYTGFCLRNRTLLGVYVSETANLPEPAHRRTTAIVRAEVRDWTAALLNSTDGLDEHVARLRVRAALAAVNDLVRLGQFASRPQIGHEVQTVALAVLQGDQPPP